MGRGVVEMFANLWVGFVWVVLNKFVEVVGRRGTDSPEDVGPRSA